MGECGVKKWSLPLIGHTQIDLYFSRPSMRRFFGRCVVLNLMGDGHITRIYDIGGLSIGVRDVSLDGGKRASRRKQNDQRLLLRASQFDPNKQELGRPAQNGAPETKP